MSTPEPILIIDPSSRSANEDMGSKFKFWFRHEGERWLFKRARPNTGEHWAEKVASEIAELLDLPTHEVRLAEYEGEIGCAVKNFLQKRETLIHGNELLYGAIKGYDKEKWQGQSDHNFENIVRAIESAFHVDETRKRASFRLVGYLVLDALVGNTDRHHENWGIVTSIADDGTGEGKFVLKRRLAPTFDHGSSLGRELLAERAQGLLDDPIALQRYIKKARGGIFLDSAQKRGLSPIALVQLIAEKYPELFKPWKERVLALSEDFAKPLLERISDESMSPISKQFTLAFLSESRKLITFIE